MFLVPNLPQGSNLIEKIVCSPWGLQTVVGTEKYITRAMLEEHGRTRELADKAKKKTVSTPSFEQPSLVIASSTRPAERT